MLLGYFKEFGREDPVLQMGGDGISAIPILIDIYKDAKTAEYKGIPPDTIRISSDGLTGGRVLVYPDTHGTEAMVSQCWGVDLGIILSENFQNYLYSEAFSKALFSSENDSRLIESKKAGYFDLLTNFASQQGFVPFWFSDSYCQCMRLDNSVWLMIKRAEDDRTNVFLSGKKHDLRDKTKVAFLKQFELKDWSPK
ncbi:hypothetical protein [Zavarzinella formosa]|uniref:hypothetical protein n=1 Tax=Zavarzinella formosa TaxID=360055 RepID=UPI001EE6475F|nr:hypothetical protein [Zavarzinella formosa]